MVPLPVILGWIAVVFISVQFLPQVYKVLRSRHVQDISLSTYILASVGAFLWIIYGAYKQDGPLLVANTFIMFSAVTLVTSKIVFGRKKGKKVHKKK